MQANDGYNILRWKCEGGRKCYLEHTHPPIEIFAECFPGKINFGDIEGIVEIQGNLLIQEWKSNKDMEAARKIPKGQDILFKNWTATGWATVFIIIGDTQTREINECALVYKGIQHPWHSVSLGGVKARMCGWAEWALKEENDRTVPPLTMQSPP